MTLQDVPLYAYLPAKDLARARRFYEDQLGFRPKQEIAGGVVYGFAKERPRSSTPPPMPARPRRARRSGMSMTSNAKSPR